MNRVAGNRSARPSSSSEEISVEPGGLQTFIDDVGRVVTSTDDEHEITKLVAKRLSDLLAGGYQLPPEVTRPSPVHHVTYPLYIAPDDSWSMASVVWDVGQRTPVHSHETWGVVGIYSGIEQEIRYKIISGMVRDFPNQVAIAYTPDDFRRLHGVARLEDHVARILEHAAKHRTDGGVVLDHEHGLRTNRSGGHGRR